VVCVEHDARAVALACCRVGGLRNLYDGTGTPKS
jgi:hypothetical protein